VKSLDNAGSYLGSHAGADQTITLPTNTVNLDGTASQAPAEA